MIRNALALFAFTALAATGVAAPAAAQCCACAYGCAPPAAVQVVPAPVQIWGLQPSYVVNQGPVYTGPGFYTSPTYEAETLNADYPVTGYYDPFDRGPYDPFRSQLYSPHWPHLPPEHRVTMLPRPQTGVIYRRGFGPRALTMSGIERHHGTRDPRYR